MGMRVDISKVEGKAESRELWVHPPHGNLGVGDHETSLTWILGKRKGSCSRIGAVEGSD